MSGPWERYRQPAAPAGPWQRYQPAATPAPTPTPAPAPRTVPAAVTTVTPQQADAYTRPRATPQQRQRDDARRGFEREFVRRIGTPETRRARALDNSDVPLTTETQADIADITAPGEGVIDFFDDYLTAGGAMVSRGIDRFAQALQTFNAENPLPWTSEENIARARAIAESRRAAAVNAEALTGAVRPGTVTIEDVVANPGLGNIGSFAGQAITQSIPATALALVNLPASVASLTGGIGQDRAVNDGRRDLSVTDAAIAAPVALGSTLLDRLGITRALSPLGTTVLGRATSAAGTNIFTEGTQEALEYAGGSVGTDTGFDPEQAAMSALAGAIAGTGQGVALSLGQDAAVGAANAVDRLGEDITARAYRDEADETFRRDSPFRILEAFDPNNGVPLTPSAGEGVASRPPAASPPAARVPLTPAAPEAATPTPEPAAPPAPLPLPETQQQGVAEPVTPALGWEEFRRDGNDRFLIYRNADGVEANVMLTIGEDGEAEISIDPFSQEPNRFGPSEIRAAAAQLRQIYPEITSFKGERQSGANPGRMQTVAAPAPNPVDEVLAPPPPQPRPANARRVIIPGGGRVDVTNEIVDASQLRFAEGEQQNRQRDRAASEAQIMSIIGEFDPEQLGDDNYSDRGAPIVGPDGTILSGNGRTMAINRIYDERPELAARYRQFLVDQGYDITGIDRPVLIRRSGEMTPEQMRSFVTGSNVDTKLQLSRPEQAAQDASDILTPEMMARYVGGSLTTQRNGGFVESFIAALPQSQRGQFMDDRGNLSTDGLTRIENAMLARAYGNGSDNARRFLSRAMEQTDNQTRTLTGALSEVAPAWGAMTQAMTEGTVDRQYDLTDKLLEAIAIIADTKGDGESVRNVLESDDMFRNMDPVVERLMRAFHSPDLRRMRSKQKIADMLERYARIAMEQRPTPDMFGDVVLRDPMDVLNDAILGDQGDLLAAEDRVPEFDQDNRPPATSERRVDFTSDTRGQGIQYHGARGELPDLAEGYYNPANIYGGDNTFYTTDAIDVAAGYRRKNETGKIYQISERAPVKTYDMEQRTSPEEIAALFNVDWDEAGFEQAAIEEAMEYPGAGRSPDGSVSLREVMDAMRRISANEGMTMDEVQDSFEIATTNLREQGFGAMTHIGGKRTGREAHNVKIYFDAPNQIDLEELAESGIADESDVLEDRSGITADDKGGYQTGFMESAFTNRPSVYEGAILATGVDPAKFRNLPPERRFALLQRVFTDLTGINVKMTKGMPINKAIDQLNDAFTTFQSLAYMLGVSPRTLSLRGTLSLELVGKANFLGAYYPGETKIALPGRSNSFAHEWAHALDYELLRNLTDEDARGLTGLVRKEGANFSPQNVRQAFVNLLNTMFFDETEMAIKIMDLEAQIAATKSAKTKADLQAQIDRFKTGSSQSRTARSRFYRAAQSMDGAKGNYWTSPTEMFARAFEAYVGDRAAMAGLGTEVISKNDQQYRSDTEKDFELRYPKLDERLRIFSAIGDLMDLLAREQILKETDQRATEAPDQGILRRMTDFDRRVDHVDNGSLLKQELTAWQNWSRRRARAMEDRADDPKSVAQKIKDVMSVSVYSMAGKLRMIERRYKAPTVRKIHDLMAWTPGDGNRRVGQVFSEEVEQFRTRNLNRMAKALTRHQMEEPTKAEAKQLRRALLGEPLPDTPQNIIELAGELRQMMDGEHYRATNVGIKLGYAKGVGYLQRAIDMGLVLGDQGKFLGQATKVYEVVFDRDIGDSVDALFENETIGKFMKLAREAGADLKAIKAINRRISQLESQQKKSADPDQIAAKLEKLYEERLELLGEIFDEVRTFFAERKAAAWLHKLLSSSDVDFDASSPDSSFTKRRELPPEADVLMEDFYTRDPIEAIQNYFAQSARRIAYARRFGPAGEKRKAMTDAMTKEGVSADDQQEVWKVVDIATGRITSSVPRSGQWFLSWVHAYGTIRLLPRAVLSSLAEPMTASFVTGNWATGGFKALAGTLGGATLNGKQRFELAEAMGIIGDPTGETILAERFGGTYGDNLSSAKLLNRMFVATGQHAVTRWQRSGAIKASHAMLHHTARRVLEGDKNAIALMTELGVRDPKAFSRELIDKGRMPDVAELDSAWGEDYTLATTRFVNMSIQNPDPMQRPQLANNPVGRIIYGIMSFTMSFWRNVTKRQAILTSQIYQRSGGKAAAMHLASSTIPAALGLLLFSSLVSTLREAILNQDKWEEWDRDGVLEEKLAAIAFFRTFSFGVADPAIQAYAGLKYQRDLANIFVGPAPGVALQNLQTILGSAERNSADNNTTEYNRTRAVYDMLIAPAINFGLAAAPGGPITTPIIGGAMMTATSPQASNTVATAIQGPKGTKTDPETGEALETPEEVEARLEAKRQRRIEREREEAGE